MHITVVKLIMDIFIMFAESVISFSNFVDPFYRLFDKTCHNVEHRASFNCFLMVP